MIYVGLQGGDIHSVEDAAGACRTHADFVVEDPGRVVRTLDTIAAKIETVATGKVEPVGDDAVVAGITYRIHTHREREKVGI